MSGGEHGRRIRCVARAASETPEEGWRWWSARLLSIVQAVGLLQ